MESVRKFRLMVSARRGPTLTLFALLTVLHLCSASAGAADAVTADEIDKFVAGDGPTVIQGAMEIGPVAPGVFQDDLRNLPRSRQWRPGDRVIERPRRIYPRPPAREPAPPAREPEVTQGNFVPAPDEPIHHALDSRAFDTPILNFDAAPFTGVNPADPVGDVGPNHYIQMVNQASGTQVRIYDKSGSLLAGPFTLTTLWTAGGACASGLGDPIVLYDPLADRWLMSEFASTGNHICIYISQTADPVSGGWFLYDISTPQFPDYLKFAVWPDAYYITTNESSPAVYALDRARMLDGLSATAQRFTGPDLAGFGFQAFTPADLDGATPPPAGAPGLFMRHRDDEVHNAPGTAEDFLEVWEFHVDFTTPANSTFTGPTNIAVSEFSSELCGLVSFSCFPQPGTTLALDPLREVIMFRLQYRNFGSHQTLVGNFVTDADGEGGGDPLERGGIRWFELRKVGAGPWSLFQEGTHSPDTNARWMGAIAMDGAGNIALGYSVSSSSVFPSLRYAGREAGDPAGTLQAEVSLVAGTASNGSNRWGDYAAMSVDPADDCTFWFTSMYSPASQWRTRIGSFKFPSCAQMDTIITSGPTAASGEATNSTTAVFNFTSSDPSATFACSLDGAAFSACTSPKTFTRLEPGAHNFKVQATAGGIIDPSPASFDWTIDKAAPNTAITSAPPLLTNNPVATFTFTSTEVGGGFQCKLDRDPFAPCTSPFVSGALADGKHTFRVKAVDAAGNLDKSAAKAKAWTVDTKPPNTTITKKPTTPTTSPNAAFKFTSSEKKSTFQCNLDSGGFVPCTSAPTFPLSQGAHHIEVRATDAAGNVDPTPAIFDWEIIP